MHAMLFDSLIQISTQFISCSIFLTLTTFSLIGKKWRIFFASKQIKSFISDSDACLGKPWRKLIREFCQFIANSTKQQSTCLNCFFYKSENKFINICKMSLSCFKSRMIDCRNMSQNREHTIKENFNIIWIRHII